MVCRLQALSDTIQRGPIPAGLTQSLERGTTRAELTSAKIVGLIARGRFRAARRQRHELETRVKALAALLDSRAAQAQIPDALRGDLVARVSRLRQDVHALRFSAGG